MAHGGFTGSFRTYSLVVVVIVVVYQFLALYCFKIKHPLCSSPYSVCSGFFKWYQWYTNIVQGSTNGTIGKTIGTNGTTNGTTGMPM